MRKIFQSFIGSLCFFLLSGSSSAQNNNKPVSINLFLDCQYFCATDYIRTEISFINYVRDVKQANVYLQITGQETGGGGSEFKLFFNGQEGFKGLDQTLKFSTRSTDTEDEMRKQLVQYIKMGLVPYLSQTPLAGRVQVNYSAPDKENKNAAAKDKWNNWVFSLRANGNLDGNSNAFNNRFHSSISATRVTVKHKWEYSASINKSKQKYTYLFIDSTGNVQELKDVIRFDNKYLEGSYVYSLAKHFSLGAISSFNASNSKSDGENVRTRFSFSPGIEYNYFPYEVYNNKSLTLAYTLDIGHNSYKDTNNYNKLREWVPSQSLTASLNLVQKWGSVSFTVAGSDYFDDLSSYQVDVSLQMGIRLFKGFSVEAYTGYSKIEGYDLRTLSKNQASFIDLITGKRRFPTKYNVYSSVGINYSFGSIYNNIVNPRYQGAVRRFFF